MSNADTYDYFQTFYASQSGRAVLADLECYIRDIKVLTPETAVGKCMLMDLLESIKTSAGFQYGTEAISLEATLAAKNQGDERTEQKKKGLTDL